HPVVGGVGDLPADQLPIELRQGGGGGAVEHDRAQAGDAGHRRSSRDAASWDACQSASTAGSAGGDEERLGGGAEGTVLVGQHAGGGAVTGGAGVHVGVEQHPLPCGEAVQGDGEIGIDVGVAVERDRVAQAVGEVGQGEHPVERV